MVYTVTLNPAVDYAVRLDGLRGGETNRAVSESVSFGGKGINVSLVLSELGVESTALGFTAGFTGQALEDFLSEKGIKTDFVHLDSGFTRINVKISQQNSETEINGSGPEIPEKKLEEFLEKIKNIRRGDALVLSGSAPKSAGDDIYEKILGKIPENDIIIAVDARKKLLLKTLRFRPFVIKPNLAELEEIFGEKLESREKIAEKARILQKKGARNVIVSMGKNGALLLGQSGEEIFSEPFEGVLVNSVGAGDSMLAGFLAENLSGKVRDYSRSMRLATACACATAYSGGLCEKEGISRFFPTK